MRRRMLLPLLAAICVGAAGCGGGGGDPLDAALGYVPKGTPVAVAIDTDLEGDQYRALRRIVRKFPFGDRVGEQIERSIEEDGNLDFDRDVKPQLGNPLVVAAPSVAALSGGRNEFVAAIEVEDAGKVEDLIKKTGGARVGEKGGAPIYRDREGDFSAVDGDVLVLSDSRAELERALDRADGEDHLDESTFEDALEGLPDGALIRAYGDIQAALRSPGAAEARKVKWVSALRTAALTASVEDDQLSIDFKAKTEPGGLTDRDLPIAPGAQAATVVKRPGEVSVGVRNPAHIVDFIESTIQTVDPSGFGQFTAGKRQIERRLRIDIDRDVLGQLSGNTSATVSVDGKFAVRSKLQDPRRFERTLARVADQLPRLGRDLGAGVLGLAKPKEREDFYALAQPDGDSVVFGVVGGDFVLSNDPARAGRIVAQAPGAVQGAEGSVVLDADAERLAEQVIRQLGPRLGLRGSQTLGAQLFTGPLGQLTGSVKVEKSGMTGRFRLGFD